MSNKRFRLWFASSHNLTLFVRYIPNYYYNATYRLRYEIVFGFLVLLAISMIIHSVRLKYKLARTCRSIDDFQREHGSEISEIILNLSKSIEIEDRTHIYNKLSRQIDDFLRKFTTYICKTFGSYIGKPCHISIKTLYDGRITSWVRETGVSESSRSTIDEVLNSFDYKENTAYSRIIDENKACYYLNNWLKLSALFRKYKNFNPAWKKSYNATLVVPITLKTHPQIINTENVWGFICVDNKGGGFDKTSAWILSSFARVCYNVFENIPIMINNCEEETDD